MNEPLIEKDLGIKELSFDASDRVENVGVRVTP